MQMEVAFILPTNQLFTQQKNIDIISKSRKTGNICSHCTVDVESVKSISSVVFEKSCMSSSKTKNMLSRKTRLKFSVQHFQATITFQHFFVLIYNKCVKSQVNSLRNYSRKNS